MPCTASGTLCAVPISTLSKANHGNWGASLRRRHSSTPCFIQQQRQCVCWRYSWRPLFRTPLIASWANSDWELSVPLRGHVRAHGEVVPCLALLQGRYCSHASKRRRNVQRKVTHVHHRD